MIDCLVIPAAGLGTRMRGVSPDLPKELLPIGDRPAVQYALAEALAAGMSEVIVVLGKGKEALRRAVETLVAPYQGLVRTKFVFQPEPRGEADAILHCRALLLGRPFAVMYPDNVFHGHPGVFASLIQAFERYQSHVVALSPLDPELARCVSNAGRVTLQPLEKGISLVTDFLPKGPGMFVPRFPGELRTCGIFLATPDFFWAAETLSRQGGSGELTDGKVRRLLLAQGKTFVGCTLPEPVYDVGNPQGYRLCWKRMIGREPELV